MTVESPGTTVEDLRLPKPTADTAAGMQETPRPGPASAARATGGKQGDQRREMSGQ